MSTHGFSVLGRSTSEEPQGPRGDGLSVLCPEEQEPRLPCGSFLLGGAQKH